MTRVRVCSAAANDYTETLCWYAERDSDVALQFEAEFEGVLAQISDATDRQPTLDENHRDLPMRRFPFLIKPLSWLSVAEQPASRRLCRSWRRLRLLVGG